MRPPAAWPLLSALLLAGPGCAATPAAPPAATAAEEEIPDALAGLPLAVVAERALFDLDSGDPERARRARCVLLALPEGPGVDALRRRVEGAPAGTSGRLEALALLAERGDPLAVAAEEEVVSMCLREMEREEPSRRAWMLALDRLRGMGESARPLLREAARPGGPRAAEAAAALEILFGESRVRALRVERP